MKKVDYLNNFRPNWNLKKKYFPVDLSRNVNFDKKTHTIVKNILLKNKKSILNYGEPIHIYKAISKYYKIPIKNLTIGFGATDIINRLISILDVKKIYIVNPSFAPTELYCKINNIKPIMIDKKDIYLKKRKDAAVCIVNPNGNDGSTLKINKKIFLLYKYVIMDEVYGDFYPENNLLKLNNKNLIVIKSLSKSIGLAGLRVGFCKASTKVTKKIQSIRLSQVCNVYAEIIVPKVISYTKSVIQRMNQSKKYLEKKYECKKSYSNYILFKKKNKLTKKFGSTKILGFYRMALADMNTLNEK